MALLAEDEVDAALRGTPGAARARRRAGPRVRGLPARRSPSSIGSREAAEEAGHHPDILVHGWNKVRLTLSTHSEGGITQADLDLAGAVDALSDAPRRC